MIKYQGGRTEPSAVAVVVVLLGATRFRGVRAQLDAHVLVFSLYDCVIVFRLGQRIQLIPCLRDCAPCMAALVGGL